MFAHFSSILFQFSTFARGTSPVDLLSFLVASPIVGALLHAFDPYPQG